MERALDIRRLLHTILTCVTAGPGLGFNRAVLFLVDDDHNALVAGMAIGPATVEEAHATWAKLARDQASLDDLLDASPDDTGQTAFQAALEGLTIPLHPAPAANGVHPGAPADPLLEAFHTRRVVKIATPATHAGLHPRLRECLGPEVVCVPLVARERSVGLIVADNAFSPTSIGSQRIDLLHLLAFLAGLALDNARIYQQVERQARKQKRTLEELKAAQERLLHAERLATVGAVVARVSHEIRNPLVTIGGFARALSARPGDGERVARNAAIIVEEVEKLEALLKEMLDFTSPRPPTFAPTDINDLITTLVQVHRDEAASRNISLVAELAHDLPPVPADRRQLERVFLNLWQNALQSLDEVATSRDRRLAVRTSTAAGTVKISFHDTGTGIPRHILPNIFTPFFTTKSRGTGLGLAVVKKIIEDHHGTVDVHSERRQGTVFTVTLPLPIGGG
jgi:signal transduction histidine kinase